MDDTSLTGEAEQLTEFRLLSEPAPLAFVDTVGKRHWDRPLERLPDEAALGRWMLAAGLVEGPVDVTPAQLMAARTLREAIYRCLRAAMERRPLAERDRRTLNRWAARPGPSPRLATAGGDAAGSGPSVTWVAGDPVVSALADLARQAVLLLGGSRLDRVKECNHPDCSLLFLDESQPRRRRWCSMEGCGNRVKVAAYHRRRTTAR